MRTFGYNMMRRSYDRDGWPPERRVHHVESRGPEEDQFHAIHVPSPVRYGSIYTDDAIPFDHFSMVFENVKFSTKVYSEGVIDEFVSYAKLPQQMVEAFKANERDAEELREEVERLKKELSVYKPEVKKVPAPREEPRQHFDSKLFILENDE